MVGSERASSNSLVISILYRVIRYTCYFFFSSRRRHTRLTCDWSSDVCSSDLWPIRTRESEIIHRCGCGFDDWIRLVPGLYGETSRRSPAHPKYDWLVGHRLIFGADGCDDNRSEERRVGKECRSRRWADH